MSLKFSTYYDLVFKVSSLTMLLLTYNFLQFDHYYKLNFKFLMKDVPEELNRQLVNYDSSLKLYLDDSSFFQINLLVKFLSNTFFNIVLCLSRIFFVRNLSHFEIIVKL